MPFEKQGGKSEPQKKQTNFRTSYDIEMKPGIPVGNETRSDRGKLPHEAQSTKEKKLEEKRTSRARPGPMIFSVRREKLKSGEKKKDESAPDLERGRQEIR